MLQKISFALLAINIPMSYAFANTDTNLLTYSTSDGTPIFSYVETGKPGFDYYYLDSDGIQQNQHLFYTGYAIDFGDLAHAYLWQPDQPYHTPQYPSDWRIDTTTTGIYAGNIVYKTSVYDHYIYGIFDISRGYGVGPKEINGCFIANSANAKGGYVSGGAIVNLGAGVSTEKISINGDFIGNFVNNYNVDGASHNAFGGAVYNSGYTAIKGSFINNYAKSDANAPEATMVAGGAIYNTGTLDLITPNDSNIVFINNQVLGGNVIKVGGAIYNSGTVNMHTTNDNKIFFGSSTDDIFNEGTINLSGGSIEFQSITDRSVLNVNYYAFQNDLNSRGVINVNNGYGYLQEGACLVQNRITINGGIFETAKNTISKINYLDGENGQFVNNGTLTVNTVSGGAKLINNGVLALEDGIFDKNVTGSGTIQINGDVIGVIPFSQSVTVTKKGTLTTNADNINGVIRNDNIVNLSGGTLLHDTSGTGSIHLISDTSIATNMKNLTINNGASGNILTNSVLINDLTVDGTLKMTITDLAKDSDSYTGGHITVDNLSLGNNSQLYLVIAPGMLDYSQSTDYLDLITVTGEQNGNFDKLAANNLYTISEHNGKYKITMTRSITDIIQMSGGSTGDIFVGTAWDELSALPGSTIAQIQSMLRELQQFYEHAYVEALKNLSPTNTPIVANTTRGLNNSIHNQVNGRLRDIHQGHTNGRSGGDSPIGLDLWAQALYNHSRQSGDIDTTGNTFGATFGADKKISNSVITGLGYTFSSTKANSDNRNIDANGHTIFVYGEYRPSNWYTELMMSYGMTGYDEKTNLISAKYTANSFGANITGGYDWDSFGLFGGARYLFISQDDYTDSVGQRIKVDNTDVLTLVAGGKIVADMNLNKLSFSQSMKLGLTYDVISAEHVAVVDIADANYIVNGKSIDPLGIEFGIDLDKNYNNWYFSLGYDLEWHHDYVGHTGKIKAKYTF